MSNELDAVFFRKLREGGQMKRDMEYADAMNRVKELKTPNTLLAALRLKNPERVRQDAAQPGSPECEVVLDDGPHSGMTIATCEYEHDATLIVEMWNWMRTIPRNTK